LSRRKKDITLPKHVSAWRDRHGKLRFRHRKAGITRYFKSVVGSAEWLAEYHEYEGRDPGQAKARHATGTLGDLITRYYRSQDFNSQGEVSRAKNRSIIEDFRQGRDDRPVALITFEHIDTMLAKKARKVAASEGRRAVGGPAAAQRLRKQLRRLFEHAVRLGMIRTNPVELTAQVKYKTGGYHTWTEEEIAQFCQRHPIGSKARLALEIILWTAQRRGDAHRFGPSHVRNGEICYKQEKGGKELSLPVTSQLRAAIDAMPSIGVKTFLVTEHGRPFSKAGFGNWFRDRCDEAGLKHCTAHGLRKAAARRLAENGATQTMIKSVGGWSNDREVALYTAGADQAELAKTALTALSEWELRQSAEPRMDNPNSRNG
jgi:integrase